MDGITASNHDASGSLICIVVIANFSHLPVNIPPKTPLCSLSISNKMECTPLTDCLSINESTPKIVNSAHVDNISLEQSARKIDSLISKPIEELC